MSFEATLTLKDHQIGDINDKEGFKVLKLHYKCEKPIDIYSGRASGQSHGSLIEIEITGSEKSPLFFQLLTRNSVVEGVITFFQITSGTKQKMSEIKFSNAIISHYSTTFLNDTAVATVDRIIFSALKIEMITTANNITALMEWDRMHEET